MDVKVSRIKSKTLRRAAIALLHPVLIIADVFLAILVGLQWFANAQISLWKSAYTEWRKP